MARLDSPLRRVSAVFVKQISEGKEKFIRQQYNIVELNYMDGSAIQTFIEPICGRPLAPTERAEVYDELRVFDNNPYPSAQIGYARTLV